MKFRKLSKDKKKRVYFALYEKNRIIWKIIKKNDFLPHYLRNYGSISLNNNKAYFVRIRNHCTVTGRSRGLIHDFSVSRMYFKYLINKGFFEGIRKSSW